MSSENQGERDDTDLTKPAADTGAPHPGRDLRRLGDFSIETTISAGGMGTVYRAFDESMKRHVALKVLHPTFGVSQTVRKRFAREAWIAGQLDHPNIIRVYSRGTDQGLTYLAMELADGGSLADEIARLRKELPPDRDVSDTVRSEHLRWVLEGFIELAGALTSVHDHGFVHRDIKPANILLTGHDRQFRLTDFGIAHSDSMTKVTRVGDFIGTIKYMSPELLTAHRATVDKRTDIYSLAVALYEALTWALPYEGATDEQYITEILAGRAVAARRRNARISRDLETVLMTGMHHDPSRRYQSAEAFADDLRGVLDGRPIRARREGIASRSLKFLKRQRMKIVLFGAPLIIIGLILFGSYASAKRAMDHRTLIQSLQTAISTDKSIDEVNPDWPRLAPRLAQLIQTSPGDSAVLWYYRSRCLVRNTSIDIGETEGSFQLLVHSIDIPFPEPYQVGSPVMLLRATIAMGLDGADLQDCLVCEAAYSMGGAGPSFIAMMDMDTLLANRYGEQHLRLRVISEHYRDAEFYESFGRRALSDTADSGAAAGDSAVVIGGGSFVPSLKPGGSCIYFGDRPVTKVLTVPDHRSATPVYTDTTYQTIEMYVHGID